MWIVYALLALNFAISWFNAWSVGRVWNESKAIGGWVRCLAWCGAIQSAIGFSSVTGFALGAVAHFFGFLPDKAMHAAISLWYLLIIVPVLSTGLIIMIESWVAAYRDRSLLNMGAAAYNTFAMAHNAYGAISGIPDALSKVVDLFDSKDDENGAQVVLIVVGLVIAALASGIVLTSVLIQRYAGTLPMPYPKLTDPVPNQA